MTTSTKTITMVTTSGHVFDFHNPEFSFLKVEELAQVLSRKCRYNGHGGVFYSVAQHAYHVSCYADLVPGADPYMALHHDDEEAFVDDIHPELKKMFPDIANYGEYLRVLLFTHFNVQGSYISPEVDQLDKRILLNERALLWPNRVFEPWAFEDLGPLPIKKLTPFTEQVARNHFIDRHFELQNRFVLTGTYFKQNESK